MFYWLAELSTQVSFFNVFRYPGGGTRWLTAEELSQWGASEVAQAMPTSS